MLINSSKLINLINYTNTMLIKLIRLQNLYVRKKQFTSNEVGC